MYFHLSTLLFLLLNVAPSDANVFSRGSHSVLRAARSVHRHAIKRSAGLAHDIRLSFAGVLVEQPPPGQNRVYCVGSSGLASSAGPTASHSVTPGSNGTQRVPSQTAQAHSSASVGTSSRTAAGSTPTASVNPSSAWKLIEAYQGNSFFNGWDFFTGGDPTNGIVTYVDHGTAQSAGLISINAAGNAVMRVETTPTVPNTRQSVRITTQRTYTGALLIMDSVHMPTGCGTWPAFWSNGPNWPAGGEIDIVEGVGDYTNNQATIHTNLGCTVASSNSTVLDITGTLVGGTNCAAVQTGNQGCGVRASQSNSFGAAFNNNGGGVYAMQWDTTGVAVYFFPRNAIPSDITANAPQPANWGTPMARWPAASCEPFTFFNSHSAIFDTTLCGDWQSAVWTAAGIPGQEQSCAQRTGSATCEAFVRSNGASLTEAYWEVKSVQIYQLQ